MGSRLLLGDKIRMAGSIVGLEIMDVVNTEYSSTKRIESGDEGSVVVGSTAGVQTHLTVMTPSHIQVLKDPQKMYLEESDSMAMRVPYDQLDEHWEILDGSVVYHEGVVSYAKRSGGELTGSNVDVNDSTQHFDVVQFNVDEDIEDLTKYDVVRIYGVVASLANAVYPMVDAIHVKIVDDKK